MERRKIIIGTAALALVSRFATAADKRQYKDFISNPSLNQELHSGQKLKALSHAIHIGKSDLPYVDIGPDLRRNY